jgi:hypothetical protein
MTNISHEIWKFLESRPDIKLFLDQKLINKTALANYIIEEMRLNVEIHAVISAIRRYDIEKHIDIYHKVKGVLSKINDISTRTNMIIINVDKGAEIMKIIPDLYSIINHEKGELLRIVHADIHVIIIINKVNLEKIKKIIPKNKIVKIEEVAEINIRFPYLTYDNEPGPGLFSMITNVIAINHISIKEVITCIPEMLIYISQKDLIKSYNALQNLCQQ